MITRATILGLILTTLTFANFSNGDEEKNRKAKGDASEKQAKQAEKIFTKIKSLAGDWVATKGEHKGQVTYSVRVVAAGSAVVEREFPGTAQEMITVYHKDGNKVMLNHYCMLGNQPRMRAKMGKSADTIMFKFAGVSNLGSKNDAHMREGRIKFIDPDTIESTWVMFKDGKASEEHTFYLARKKK